MGTKACGMLFFERRRRSTLLGLNFGLEASGEFVGIAFVHQRHLGLIEYWHSASPQSCHILHGPEVGGDRYPGDVPLHTGNMDLPDQPLRTLAIRLRLYSLFGVFGLYQHLATESSGFVYQ